MSFVHVISIGLTPLAPHSKKTCWRCFADFVPDFLFIRATSAVETIDEQTRSCKFKQAYLKKIVFHALEKIYEIGWYLRCAMPCFAVLYYTMNAMLCYVTLRYVTLCYVMLCYFMLRYVTLYYVMLCYALLCYVTLRCVMLCYALLCYVMLCSVTLRYVTLRYAMLCYAIVY